MTSQISKMEDDLNFKWKNPFFISLKFRGKPFLGLAQLSKILSVFNMDMNEEKL